LQSFLLVLEARVVALGAEPSRAETAGPGPERWTSEEEEEEEEAVRNASEERTLLAERLLDRDGAL